MRGVLMEKHPASVNLFLVEFSDEFHVSHSFRQLLTFPVAVCDQELQLAERYARGASNEH